jgi:hypothetical protein
MTSQTDIEHTSFLEDCITRKRTTRDIYEALDLYCETAETRKDPVFVKADANKLQKDIKNLAQSFRESYRNDEKTLLVDLVKDSAFIDEVGELGLRTITMEQSRVSAIAIRRTTGIYAGVKMGRRS